MRDIALTLIVFGLIPYVLIRPQVGIYLWSWLSYMNPHRMTWGFAYTMPFAQITAIATLLAILFWKEPKRIPITGLTVLWIAFLLWMVLTTVFAINFDNSLEQLEKVMKIQLVTFLTLMVIKTKKDLNILIWVIALSIGYFGIKGGIFTIRTFGGHRVWGPSGSFIEDNNALAVALLMVLPFFYYLRLESKQVIVRMALLFAMILLSISIVGSQSRGAFVAIIATGAFLWLKMPGKIISGFFLLTLAAAIFTFMPESWHERMDSIINYEQDVSAMGRINTWGMTLNLANDRIFGGGLNLWGVMVDSLYMENIINAQGRAAHSIYFSVLGEHGWIGLMLFLAIFFTTWRKTKAILLATKDDESMKWLNTLTKMTQVSLVAYLSGGAFLSLSYFDLPWHLIAIVVVSHQLAMNAKALPDNGPEEFLKREHIY